jgi:subtilisin family serine protease
MGSSGATVPPSPRVDDPASLLCIMLRICSMAFSLHAWVSRRIGLLYIGAAAISMVNATGWAQLSSTHFVERPGVLQFSGRMIVRPAQHDELHLRGSTPEEINAIRERAAGTLRSHEIEYIPETDEYIVQVPSGATESGYAEELMATGDYEYAVPDWICFPLSTIPDDPSLGMQWHHPKVHSFQAWDITTGDSNLIIAIVDGGVQLDHTDLAGALVSGYNSADKLEQSAGGDVSDVDGHGTFVAGLAGAIGNNGVHVVGMGWNFSLMPVRYYNSPGGGYLSDLLDGVRWAANHGARCVNVSQTGVEYAAVQTTGAYVKARGGLLFWAAGNDGRDLSWFDWDDVIVVGATNQSDLRPSWSAYGLAVDVFAPGTDIVSTGLPGGLAIGSGTSAASPIAAGIGGLIWSLAPNLPPDDVEEYLFAGCVDLGAPGEDDSWGWGRVDAHATLAGPDPVSYCSTSPNSVGPGALISWHGTSSLFAADFTLVASDCPANQFLMFYYGAGQTQTVFGNGWRCVNAGGAGIFRFKPFPTDIFGFAVLPVDFAAPPVGPGGGLGKWIVGDTWYCQGWYRDPAGGAAQFNLTDGLAVTVHL